MKIRIVIIDDHALFREMLAKSLAVQVDFEVAGMFASSDEALELIKQENVDLVLLDINLGATQGNSFLTSAKAAGFRGKVLVVTAGVSEREAVWLLRRGSSGIFLKNDPPDALFRRIREIMSPNREPDPAGPTQTEAIREDRSFLKPLTRREREVLRGICEGLANKEIAQQLGITQNTVKVFIQQLFDKAGVRSRAQLVRVAIERYWEQLEN